MSEEERLEIQGESSQELSPEPVESKSKPAKKKKEGLQVEMPSKGKYYQELFRGGK